MVQRVSHAAWRRIGDETVVINVRTQRMVGLNAAGAWVWECLARPASRDQLVRWMGAGVGATDLDSFIDELMREDLVTAGPAAAADASPADASAPVQPPVLEGPPCILWHEKLQAVAATCAVVPAQGDPCGSVPYQ